MKKILAAILAIMMMGVISLTAFAETEVEAPAVEEIVTAEAASEEVAAEEQAEEETAEETPVEEETADEEVAEEEVAEEAADEPTAEEEPVDEESVEEAPAEEEAAEEEAAEEETVAEESAEEETVAEESAEEETADEETAEEEPSGEETAEEEITDEEPAVEETAEEESVTEETADEDEGEEIITDEEEQTEVQEIEEYETALGLNEYQTVVLDEEEDVIDVREDADGMSAIFDSLPEGTEITVIEIVDDWAHVVVNGQEGYIFAADLAKYIETPEEETAEIEDPAAGKKVTIFSSRRTVMRNGEPVTLTSRLEGFEDVETITYQWFVDTGDGSGFQPVEGANEETYTFAANSETLTWSWRLRVSF